MIALKMEDLKACTSQLFVGNTFDPWLLREASITTFNTFMIDGRVRQGYYTELEMEENQIEKLSAWKVLRPICFSLIKGKKLPGSFHIMLQYPPKNVKEFLQSAGLGYSEEQVGGLYINFRYEDHVLSCVTGISLNIFTMDRQMDREWDKFVRMYLKGKSLPFTEG